MSEPNIALATTNTMPNSCVATECDCGTMWSRAQQFSTIRLCVRTGKHKGKLVKDYSVRARRIAATYARLYLEIEEGGSPDLKGRYYLMAIGAFASKTVACTFDAWQVQGLALVDKTVKEGLGKGNFWLFCDISGSHWYRNMYPKSFDQCISKRNAENSVREVKAQLKQLPWNSEALPKINNLGISTHIIEGFEKVNKFENASKRSHPAIQFANLLDLAMHEQGIILQPLIYDDRQFASKIELQRSKLVNWASPPVKLVFSHSCGIDEPDLKSIAPHDIKLEDFESRMAWTRTAAGQFHNLMQRRQRYMERELQTMATWVDLPDNKGIIETLQDRAVSASETFNQLRRKIGQ